jgi:hypothetical protein
VGDAVRPVRRGQLVAGVIRSRTVEYGCTCAVKLPLEVELWPLHRLATL